jgi:predicted ATPase
MMGVTCAQMGEFALAMEHSEKALSQYDPERHHDDAFYYSQNPGVGMLCHAAWTLWFLGQPDQALQRMEEGLTLAHDLSEPHGLAHAFFFAAILHQLRREARLAQERAEVAIAVSSEHGLMMYQAHSTIARGWALIEQGIEEGIEQMRLGIAAHQATGAEVTRSHFLTLLAEALGKARQPEQGLCLLEEALDLANHNGDRYYLAELYRVKGELLLMPATGRGVSTTATSGKAGQAEPPAVAQAEACFHQAIKIAQQQEAKSLELRAVMSLARLDQDQDKQKKARDLLAQIYDSFTEGFETMDLREAKALLDELA